MRRRPGQMEPDRSALGTDDGCRAAVYVKQWPHLFQNLPETGAQVERVQAVQREKGTDQGVAGQGVANAHGRGARLPKKFQHLSQADGVQLEHALDQSSGCLARVGVGQAFESLNLLLDPGQGWGNSSFLSGESIPPIRRSSNGDLFI